MATAATKRRKRSRPAAQDSGGETQTVASKASAVRDGLRRHAALLAILGLATALRLYRLMADFPIVGDEGIYLRWAEIIDHQGQWFISLLDGKQPLNFWVFAVERMLWPDVDPLWMARLTSVAAGVASTYCLYRIGVRLGGRFTGLLAAALYAVFPWAMMFDRLAYTEALLHLGGLLFMWACLRAFDEDAGLGRAALAGLALGAAYFVKTPAALFAPIALIVGLWKAWGDWSGLAKRWAAIFAVAAIFPVISAVMKPEAPMFETHDLLLHQTTFFADPAKLAENPFYRLEINGPRFGEYLPYLIGWPALAAIFVSAGYLLWRRSAAGVVVFAIGAIPLAVELFLLTFLPTRYPFAFLWPWLLLTALAGERLWRDLEPRLAPRQAALVALGLVGALAFAPMLWRSWRILNDPRNELSPHDTGYFFGDYSHAGFGVREAVEFLKGLAREGPYVLLVDPIWSVPADAIFPYLNHKYGIRVYEAWWTQLSGDHEILPTGEAELMRSHYERIPAETIDFRREPRVYYLTDTNYYKPEAVAVRQPDAQLLVRFPKPNREHSIDIYRLK